MSNKTGIGSYPANDPESGGKADVNPDERIGSNKPRKKGQPDLADSDRIQKDLDRYRDEMAEDAPASNSPEDNP
jgi:hypothetical protein